jgi:hypothetical protein
MTQSNTQVKTKDEAARTPETASEVYAAPQLVAVGEALELVQGCSCCGCYRDCNGYYRYDW